MRGRLSIIGAIVRKDVVEFTRDRFYVLVTVLGLVFYVAIFWVLPSSVDETIEIGVSQGGGGVIPAELLGGSSAGMDVVEFATSEDLQAAVKGEADPSIVAGIEFPAEFLPAVAAGEATTVKLYVQADTPAEIEGALESFVREIAFAAAGEALPVRQPATEDIVLGEDRMGAQVALQDQMGPLFVFFVLIIETLALGTLIAGEIQTRTVTAILASPARLSDFLAAKAVLGTGLAFVEAVLLALAIGLVTANPGVMLVTLLLGSVLVTGFGLLAGATGRDFMTIVFVSMAFMIPLAVPAFAVLFPGTAAGWVKAIPTYGLVESIVRASAYGDGFAELLPWLGTLLTWSVVVFLVGLAVLRRRVASI